MLEQKKKSSPPPKLNPDFMVDLFKLTKRFTKDNISYLNNQTYTQPMSAYTAVSGHISTRNITEFNVEYEKLKNKYEKKNQMFNS